MSRLTLSVCLVACALTVTGAAVGAWAGPTDGEDVLLAFSFSWVGIACAVTGAMLAGRLPGNAVGWPILTIGLGIGVLWSTASYAELGIDTSAGPLPGQEGAAWVSMTLGIPVFFGLPGLLLQLFPTGRTMSRSWTWTAWVFGVVVTTAMVSYSILPGVIRPGIENPLGATGAAGDVVEVVARATDWLGFPAVALCALALVVRTWHSTGTERLQLKWFTSAATLVGVSVAVAILAPGLFSDVALVLTLVGLTLLPVSAWVGILRHRLYDIDVVIKRTLVYTALTVVLVATYVVLVLLLQTVLSPVAGDSDLAVAGSTLAVAALFRPLRSAIQRGVDRRFFRSSYDAARTLDDFSERLRHDLELDSLGTDLRAVVTSTMQPEHVSLWLRMGGP
ncbi:hypothetical protein [Nocardioides sp. GXQ0305]|uniref:hypothetical protein n=1 Tax=Nocardioides sp. GXQ0305 TaxID=3423912 RepID=UPI003D7F0AE6